MSGTSSNSGKWQFWVDRGGTFTDIVACKPDGALVTHKLLSENPGRYDDAALQGVRDLLGVDRDADIPTEAVEAVKMGTTVATNALLERNGERTVLLITKGFHDALRIGYQNRPHLFARHIVLPELLYERVVEVDERYSAEGEELRPVDLGGVRAALEKAYADGIRSVAIVFVHGYRHHDHEIAVAEIAREVGFPQVSVSHEVSPLMKLVGRGDTTVVDAYVSPILRRYVDRVASELGEARLMFMQSNGGLADARFFQGKDSILSGPAGGIVGAVRTSHMAGFDKIITFDMGGTSTDVAHFNGEYERAFETLVAGVRMRAPMMRIHTVAAGGGSILHFDSSRYRVGPDSAGADPGPACYRRGGPLTVTDANLMVGKIQSRFFPRFSARRPTRPWTPTPSTRNSPRSPPKSKRRRAMSAPPSRWPTATSRSPSTTWPTPSRRSRSSAATTSPSTPSTASAAPAASTPAWWPTRWASPGSSSIPSPECFRPTAWGWPSTG